MKHYLPLFLITAAAFGEYRDITNNSGQVISARVLSLEGEFVKLKRSDQRVFTIPLSSLATSEIETIKAQFAEPKTAEEEIAVSEFDTLRKELDDRYPIDEKMSKSEAYEANRQAHNYQNGKEFERAIEIWASIPEKRSQYADARRRAGYNILGRELGRWNEALVFLLDAYDADPKNRDVLEDLGRA